MTRTVRAIALISGGLDSMLAARVVQEQGVHVEGLTFYTGFATGATEPGPRAERASRVAERLGMPLHVLDVVEDYRPVVQQPRYGYGAHLNPCLDCKIFMVRRALEWMYEQGFDFILTGEVIGQRPKSQLKKSMPVVQRESGAGERLLRPLCARLLEPTLPERCGWVDRERLYAFNGRSRKPQMALAARLGIQMYEQPSGGCCYLTDPVYAEKLADLWRDRGGRDYEREDILLLQVGRHFRPGTGFKVIIARTESEGAFIRQHSSRAVALRPVATGHPESIIQGTPTPDDLHLAARLVARYARPRHGEPIDIEVSGFQGVREVISAKPIRQDEIGDDWLL